MHKKILLTTILFIAATALFGQKEFLNGYVILEEGDTVYGKLAVLSDVNSCSKIKFKDKQGNKVDYGNKEVKAYKRGNYYYAKKQYKRPKLIGNSLGYMKLIKTGKVNLYEYLWTSKAMSADGTFFYTGMVTTNYYIEKGEQFQIVKTAGFKKKMPVFFLDNEKLCEKIRSKELRYHDLIKIVEIYNGDLEL